MSTDTITSNVTTGVTLDTGGTYGDPVTVASGVTVSGSPGVYIYAPWTVENEGVVSGSSLGILVTASGTGYVQAWITNDLGATIVAAGRGIGIGDGSGPISVDNAGYIGSYKGIVLVGGSVTNEATGTIQGGGAGIAGYRAAATIINAGSIHGDFIDGVHLAAYSGSGSSLVDNSGTITSLNNGVYIAQSNATVENTGAIGSRYSDGIKIRATSASVANSGSIYGQTDGVYLSGINVTLEDSGTISGTLAAVYLAASGTNRLIVEAGAVFQGVVVAQATAAANTLELSAAGGAGTIHGLGSQYQGFHNVTIDTGGTWDIAGTIAGFKGTTINGLSSHDRLDLTDLSFNAGDTATLDNGSDLLTIEDSGGAVLATVQLDGSVAGELFKLVSDGHGGTFAEETDYTPCFCRGTLIRTFAGDRPVEDLRIGDFIITLSGEALPIKWIGRRSYRDWLAVGNAEMQPILFKAGSLADGVPARDLHVSPEHAMFLDGVLVPARHLVNGQSILKMKGLEEIDYFHLEFDRHVVIFAEDAPAESFVDDDSRMLFHNADEYRRLYPDEPRRRDAEFCAPRVEDGPVLHALHRGLAVRATHLRDGGVAAPWGRRGKIDVATRTLVSGWAFAGADAGPLSLAILVNGAIVGTVVADRYRADLKAAGIGDGRHGFRFLMPKGLAPDIDHRIEVRREIDWSLL